MGTRHDLPKLPGKEPSYFNIDTAAGAGIGSLFGPIGALAGGAIGGYMGKQRMQQEAVHGRPVNQPTYLNKGVAIGLLVGGIVTALIAAPALLATAAAVGAGSATGATIGSIVTIGAVLLGNVGSVVVGSRWRYKQMEQDVAQSEGILRNPQLMARIETERAAAQAQQYAQAPSQQSHQSFVDRVEASRAQAAEVNR